eukprot:Lankesteria_metandrocarpae@DN4962_c0_g1_i1.p1
MATQEIDLNEEQVKTRADAQPDPLVEVLECTIKRLQEGDDKLQQLVTAVRYAVLSFYGIPLAAAKSCNMYTHSDQVVEQLRSTAIDGGRGSFSVKSVNGATQCCGTVVQQEEQQQDSNDLFAFETKAFLNDTTVLRALRSRKYV